MAKNYNDFDLNKFIHEKSRLLILTTLATVEQGFITFTELKKRLNFTSGNLSVQLSRLEEAGLITLDKKIVNNKPLTKVFITKEGSEALEEYFNNMEKLINRFKQNSLNNK
jgi:DNA-binding MarR family transcriptional regulator